MSTAQLPSPPSAQPDRSTRLMVVGGLQIVLGCLCFLLVAAMMPAYFLGPLLQGPQGRAVDTTGMISAIFIYVALGAMFLWLGIGMIRIRRWAWTLTVVWSWLWLIIGLFSFAIVQLFMGQKMWAAIAERGKMPPDIVTIARTTATLTTGFIYIFVPAVFVVLCHNQSVKATCYRRDPQPRWTDRCPMPVLAVSILLAFGAFSSLTLLAYKCVMPLFGALLSGTAGALAIVLMALVFAYLAWGTYRLQTAAWWGALLFGLAAAVNWAVTARRGDLIQIYQRMGMPADQIALMRKMGIAEMTSRWGPWMSLASGAAWLGYLLFVRRYFRSGRDAPAATT
jgi:hypothetical protein